MNKLCPICDSKNVSIKKIKEQALIKGENIEFDKQVFVCEDCGCTIEDGSLVDINLNECRNQYRRNHHLLTSSEIAKIREKYDLSQADLALILGWGEVTITRYETKEIQNSNYDRVLRWIDKDPYVLYIYFKLNSEIFNERKQNKIAKKIISVMGNTNSNKVIEDELKRKHLVYRNDETGDTEIKIDKILAIMKRLVDNKIVLFKTKLAKLLWYIDMINYRKNKKSMTGFAYIHMQYGAYPMGLDLLMDSKNLEVEYNEYDDSITTIIRDVKSDFILDDDEIEIIDYVSEKFKEYKTSDIVSYMHNEKGYVETKEKELISYDYSKYLSI